MPIDTSMYRTQPTNVLDVIGGYQGLAMNRQKQQANALALQQAESEMQAGQRAAQEQAAIKSLLAGAGGSREQAIRALEERGYYGQADALRKAAGEDAYKGAQTRHVESQITKEGAETEARRGEALGKRLDQYRSMLTMVKNRNDLVTWVTAQHQDPVTKDFVSKIPLDQMIQSIPEDPVKLREWVEETATGMEKFVQNKTTQRGQDITAETSIANNAATNATHIATNAATNKERAADRAVQRDRLRFDKDKDKNDSKTPKPADIVDPANPDQMIKVDLNKWNPATREGVIGVAGREPSAALRINKREEGKRDAKEVIDSLRVAYDNLEKMRAIPSDERNAASNLASGIAATGIGQAAGKLVGTKAQTERNVIKSSRMQLLNTIKSATGMSAQQMNSNVELMTWLDAVSDPSQSKESVDRILNNIETFIASGGKKEASPKIEPSSNPGNKPSVSNW